MASQVKPFTALLLLVLLWCGPDHAKAFTPSAYLDFTARNARFNGEVRDGVSRTHASMIEGAVLRVSADLLKDNPNPDPDVDSTARINALKTLTPKALIDAYFRGSLNYFSRRYRRYRYEQAIEDIADASEETDTGSDGTLAAAHFDSEQFQAGQDRLVSLRKLIVARIQNKKYERAREAAGSMLHTLQDFYSHTNWIEMGQRNPNTALGKEGHQLHNIASSTTSTCSDCTRDGKVGLHLDVVGLLPFLNPAKYYYRCTNNIRPEVNAGQTLTSGYHTDQIHPHGHVLHKPEGKCSHGGFGDPSSDIPATGGINKDSISLDWSPHADLHDAAAAVALQATVDILQDIRRDVQNDARFAAFLRLELSVVASITYVIDTTGSMGSVLPEIRAMVPRIRMFLEDYLEGQGGRATVRFILVPFNDPEPSVTMVTEDVEEFLNSVGNLQATGGDDSPKPSMGALLTAIRASEPGSQIFVYTDASASDFSLLDEVLSLIQATRVSITFIVTGNRLLGRKNSAEGNQYNGEAPITQRTGIDAYYLIASTSGGQVLNVDGNELSSLIGFFPVQGTSTVFYKASSLTQGHIFSVDETVHQVLISVNGIGAEVKVMTPEGVDSGTLDPSVYQLAVDTVGSYVAIVHVSESSTLGQWQLKLRTSGRPYTVRIRAVSDLDFVYTLYRRNPSSKFGFVSVEDPLAGEMLALFVQLKGDFEEVELNRVVLLTADGEPIQSLKTTDIGNGGYTCFFMTPNQLFQIQIVGTSTKGYPISRISATGRDPVVEQIGKIGSDTDMGDPVYKDHRRAGPV